MIITEGKISDRIVIICGRFQPLTKAHYEMIEKVRKMYHTIFIFPVQGPKAYQAIAKTDKGKKSELSRKLSRSPFPVGLRIDLINKAFPKIPNDHIIHATSGGIEYIYNTIKRLYPSVKTNKLDVYAGPDEYESYQAQLKYIKNKDLDIKIIKHDVGSREEVSATKLRAALINPDKEEGYKIYKKLAAPPLADVSNYNRLRRVIQKINIEESMRSFMNQIKEDTSDGIVKNIRVYLRKYYPNKKINKIKWATHDCFIIFDNKIPFKNSLLGDKCWTNASIIKVPVINYSYFVDVDNVRTNRKPKALISDCDYITELSGTRYLCAKGNKADIVSLDSGTRGTVSNVKTTDLFFSPSQVEATHSLYLRLYRGKHKFRHYSKQEIIELIFKDK